MRLNEFAPDMGGSGGGHGRPLPWSQVVKEATSWFQGHGFNAKHAPGADAIQFSKELDDHDEQVWLMGVLENMGERIGFQFGSITNGEMDEPLDDYRGTVPMTTKGLNQALLLAEEAFGL